MSIKRPDRYYWPYDNPKENTDSIEVIERWAVGGDTEYSVDGGKVWWTKEQYEAVKVYAEKLVHQARVDELERLHRYQGEGLPLRDYDNETDELIDERLEELESKEESI